VSIEIILRDAVQEGIGMALTEEVQDIVVKETRRALREHEEEITQWIRTAVRTALEEALRP
jgi:hypothetical protein